MGTLALHGMLPESYQPQRTAERSGTSGRACSSQILPQATHRQWFRWTTPRPGCSRCGKVAWALRRLNNKICQIRAQCQKLTGKQSARCGWYGKAGENKVAQPAMEESKKLQSETITKLRTLSHDLSNYIETIMQASYLLAQAKLDENNKKWLDLVDKAAQDAARVNREIREMLRSQN